MKTKTMFIETKSTSVLFKQETEQDCSSQATQRILQNIIGVTRKNRRNLSTRIQQSQAMSKV